jgi:hypothetical protein
MYIQVQQHCVYATVTEVRDFHVFIYNCSIKWKIMRYYCTELKKHMDEDNDIKYSAERSHF